MQPVGKDTNSLLTFSHLQFDLLEILIEGMHFSAGLFELLSDLLFINVTPAIAKCCVSIFCVHSKKNDVHSSRGTLKLLPLCQCRFWLLA